MAKASPKAIDTPGMSSKQSQKPSQPPKSIGKQTTLLGFFSKVNPGTTTASTPATKRVEARPAVLLTPLPSSEVGDEETPIKIPGKISGKGVGGLRTPVTPVTGKTGDEMDIDTSSPITGSRNVTCIEKSVTNEVEASRYQLC